MPPTRTDYVIAPEPPVAAVAAAPAVPTSAGAGFTAWLPLILTVLFMPLLAYLTTTFILVPQLQKGLGAAPPATVASDVPGLKSTPAGGRKESVMMNKLLVNVAGTMGSRYLLVSLSLVGSDPDFRTKVQDFEPQLRDTACGALASKTLADLEKPGARNLIRSELITGFNNVLSAPLVQELYLTEFAIQ